MGTGRAMAWWMLAGAASALASACVMSHPQTDPLPLPRFCDAFFDAVCEPLTACECGETALAICRAQQGELCAGFPSAAMVRAVDEGRLRYDGVAAAALVDRMQRRGDRCESFIDSLDWRVRDLFTVGGVFEGTVPAGGSCSVLGFELISECALGSCAPSTDGYVCRVVVGEGERCDETHQCADLGAALTIDSGLERLSLRCVPDATSGVCEPWIADGGACTSGGECESGLCVDTRCASRAIGEPCVTSRECVSGSYCALDGRCASASAVEGASCDESAACASHVCVAGTCLPAGCGTF